MKLDLGKILKSINKGERPSSDTLYVSSKNDPRLRAYQDSLNLYKGSESEKDIQDVTKYGQYKKVKPYLKGQKIQPVEMYMPDLEVIKDLEKKGIKYSVTQPIVDKDGKGLYYKTKDGSVIDKRDGTIVLSQADRYKKPERPVAYRKPTVDTVYVDNPNDPRLKAYNDSLGLYNDAKKYYDISTIGNYGYKTYPFGKNYSLKAALADLKFKAKDRITYSNIPKKYLKYYSKEDFEQSDRINRISKKTFSSKINPIGTYPVEGFALAYKKPVQPVEYRKPEHKKQNIEQVKQEVLQAIQNKYEGRPVYSSTAGSGGPSSLVGFENKGDTTFIRPEDFDRFAVPKYARQFIQSKSKKK
jgi:hypothetical protein